MATFDQAWGRGVLTSSSGLSSAERESLISELRKAGAEYTASYSKRCTHLVVAPQLKQPLSLKIAQAIRNRSKWRTHIVSLDWVLESARKQVKQAEELYLPEHVCKEIQRQSARSSAKDRKLSASLQAQKPEFAATMAPPASRTPFLLENGNVTVRASHRSRPATLSRFAREDCSSKTRAAVDHAASRCKAGLQSKQPMSDNLTQPQPAPSLASRPEAQGCDSVQKLDTRLMAVARSYESSLAAQQADKDWPLRGNSDQPHSEPRLKQPVSTARDEPPLPPLAEVLCNRYVDSEAETQRAEGVSGHTDYSEPLRQEHAESAGAENVSAWATGDGHEVQQDDAVLQNLLVKLRQQKMKLSERQPDLQQSAERGLEAPDFQEAREKIDAKPLSDRCADPTTPFTSFLKRFQRRTEKPEPLALEHCQKTVEVTGLPALISFEDNQDGRLDTIHAFGCSDEPEAGRSAVPESAAPSGASVDVAERLRAWAGANRRAVGQQLASTLTAKSPKLALVALDDDHLVATAVSDRHAVAEAQGSHLQGPATNRRPAFRSHESLDVQASQPATDDDALGSALITPEAFAISRNLTVSATEAPASPPELFRDLIAFLDPAMSSEHARRARELIEAGGGSIAKNKIYLGSSATHVVCYPEAAGAWVSMGANVVSPEWLELSTESGCRLKCLQISMDSLQHLPATTSELKRPATREISPPPHYTQCEMAPQNTAAPRLCPAHLLDGLHWAVSEPLESARLDSQLEQEAGSDASGVESCSPSQAEARLFCARMARPEAVGRELSAADWETVIFRGSGLTLLLPQDSHGDLGHASSSIPVPKEGLTRRELMQKIATYYQEESEEGAPCLAGSLGSCVQLEGLLRVSRSRAACVYELCLTS